LAVAAEKARTVGNEAGFVVVCMSNVEGVVPAAEDVDVEHAASVGVVSRDANSGVALRDVVAPLSFESLRMREGDVVCGQRW
jgi:hypothetical protein